MVKQKIVVSGVGGQGVLFTTRVLGETAPLIMTALGSSVINYDITKPTSAIPLLIWEFYNDPNMVNLVWSSALFLIVLVLTLNILSRRIASKNKIGKTR